MVLELSRAIYTPDNMYIPYTVPFIMYCTVPRVHFNIRGRRTPLLIPGALTSYFCTT
jgi:hypothetical protein